MPRRLLWSAIALAVFAIFCLALVWWLALAPYEPVVRQGRCPQSCVVLVGEQYWCDCKGVIPGASRPTPQISGRYYACEDVR